MRSFSVLYLIVMLFGLGHAFAFDCTQKNRILNQIDYIGSCGTSWVETKDHKVVISNKEEFGTGRLSVSKLRAKWSLPIFEGAVKTYDRFCIYDRVIAAKDAMNKGEMSLNLKYLDDCALETEEIKFLDDSSGSVLSSRSEYSCVERVLQEIKDGVNRICRSAN